MRFGVVNPNRRDAIALFMPVGYIVVDLFCKSAEKTKGKGNRCRSIHVVIAINQYFFSFCKRFVYALNGPVHILH